MIPEKYRLYETAPGVEEDFLLANSGQGPNRILIFGRRGNLELLRDSNIIYGDGTFKTAPVLFSQIYTLLGKRFGGVHPIVYALLPNKQRSTYQSMFELIQGLQPDFLPAIFSCDFEIATITAVKNVFPAVQINCCFFHLTHNLKKKLFALGFANQYNNDAEFSLKVKMVAALGFVAINDLDEAIEVLSAELPDEMQPLLGWFEDNYVGRRNRRGPGRRAAPFPPEI